MLDFEENGKKRHCPVCGWRNSPAVDAVQLEEVSFPKAILLVFGLGGIAGGFGAGVTTGRLFSITGAVLGVALSIIGSLLLGAYFGAKQRSAASSWRRFLKAWIRITDSC